MVQQGDITQGHARALLPLGDEQEQIEFAKKIKQNGLSVRATESGVADRIQALDGGDLRIVDAEGNSRPVPRPRNEQLESLQQELRTALGTKVDLSQSAKGKGKLTIHFTSHEEFERIRQLLTATQAVAPSAAATNAGLKRSRIRKNADMCANSKNAKSRLKRRLFHFYFSYSSASYARRKHPRTNEPYSASASVNTFPSTPGISIPSNFAIVGATLRLSISPSFVPGLMPLPQATNVACNSG